jgi:hypothetical protein
MSIATYGFMAAVTGLATKPNEVNKANQASKTRRGFP